MKTGITITNTEDSEYTINVEGVNYYLLIDFGFSHHAATPKGWILKREGTGLDDDIAKFKGKSRTSLICRALREIDKLT